MLSCWQNWLSDGYLGTMHIRVRRNAYGRQLGSFHTTGAVDGIGADVPMTFIRAPYIEKVLADDCSPIAIVDGHIVAARQGNQIATAFHPEPAPASVSDRYDIALIVPL